MRRRFVRPRLRAVLTAEQLEQRLALTGSPSGLFNPAGLTLSFVPDGTLVTDKPSELAATLADKSALPQWQATIARAFQTWAQYANVNIGVVPDGGERLGIPGSTSGDPRFGDIRVAGIPLSLDTTAEAIGQQRTLAGTWAGDVVINTAATFADDNALFSVALHEAGHALGLGHSSDPNSPMFVHGVSNTAGPTPDDIANLQAIYGARRPDIFEGSNGNDTVNRATRIPHAEPIDGYDGHTPLVIYGDLQNAADKDVFLLPVLHGYSGPLTFELWTAGISLLQGHLSVLDGQGSVVGEAQSTGSLGDVISVQVPAASGTKYYIRVEAAGSTALAAGAFGVVVKYDQLLTTSAVEIQKVVLAGHQWQASTDDSAQDIDVRNLLTSTGVPQLDNDQHQDDTTNHARTLSPVFDSAAVRTFQFVGTISDATDLDQMRIRSQSSPSSARGLMVTVESLESSALIPQIVVRDKNGQTLPATPVVSGNGLVVLQVAGIVPNQDYFVQIAAKDAALGNYRFAASFDDVSRDRTSVLAGTLDATHPFQTAALYIARPQLFSFALQSAATGGVGGNQPIWAIVTDEKGHTVAFLGTSVGEFRSEPGVLLKPGTYQVRVEGRDASDTTGPNATFALFADAVSDPLGPPPIDPGTQPIFPCQDQPDGYCYPGQPPTTDPSLVVLDPLAVADPLPPPIDIPPDAWFWPVDYLLTNPLNAMDTDADGSITPTDVLLIINLLNAVPLGSAPETSGFDTNYLDVSVDGFVAPDDALMIINELNAIVPPADALAAGGSAFASGTMPAAPATQSIGATDPNASLLQLIALDVAFFGQVDPQGRTRQISANLPQ